MKALIIIFLILGILIPTVIFAARFEWVFGKPTIVEDLDNTTHGTRYDWVLGKPTIVREVPTVATASLPSDINLKSGSLILKSGNIIIK